MTKIHPTALVSSKATLGDNVHIGPYAIVHDNVIIGNNVNIEAYCELGIKNNLTDGSPLVIGNNSFIRSHSIFYESSTLGEGLITGHRVTVREKTKGGKAFQIGTATEIQGHCTIGDYVRFQSNIFVSQKTQIGNFVWVLPYVVFTNDPTPPSEDIQGCIIKDYASICAKAVIMPGIVVGTGTLVGAGACVTKNVDDHTAVAGVPAKFLGYTKNILRRNGKNEAAYPWIKHFHRGYPKSITEQWNEMTDSDFTGVTND